LTFPPDLSAALPVSRAFRRQASEARAALIFFSFSFRPDFQDPERRDSLSRLRRRFPFPLRFWYEDLETVVTTLFKVRSERHFAPETFWALFPPHPSLPPLYRSSRWFLARSSYLISTSHGLRPLPTHVSLPSSVLRFFLSHMLEALLEDPFL